MGKKKYWILLIIIFLLNIALRLYFAYQTPYLSSSDSYFVLRQVENIKETGKPLFSDPLSYGGRFFTFPPFFEYLLTFFSLFIPLAYVVKIIPAIFAAGIIIIAFLITLQITKNNLASIITAFLAGFNPLFFSQTTNTLSQYSLEIPLIFLIFYFFILVDKNPKYSTWLVLCLFLLIATHPSAIILVLGLIFYLIMITIERIKDGPQKKEITLFAIFLILWFQFILYKEALHFHGMGLIWQNIPTEIMNSYFSNIKIIDVIYAVGTFPLIFGIYIIYKYVFKEKNKSMHLLIGYVLSLFILLYARLIPLETGLLFLSTAFVLLFGVFLKLFYVNFEKTKIFAAKNYVTAFIIILLAVTSILPSFDLTNKSIKNTITKEEIDFYQWVNIKLEKNATILAPLEYGHYITYFGKRKNVIDSNFLLIHKINERLSNIIKVYQTRYETDAIPIMNKYGANYVIFSEEIGDKVGLNNLLYVDDPLCFEKVYEGHGNKKIVLYKLKCRM